jgi:hypothetical protein
MRCSSCGASAESTDCYCSFCDSDLKLRHLSNTYFAKDLRSRVLSEDESTLFNSIRDLSRKLRRSRFGFADLESLLDLEEDILFLGSDGLLARFTELLELASLDYVKKNSIVLFGQNKELFDRYL